MVTERFSEGLVLKPKCERGKLARAEWVRRIFQKGLGVHRGEQWG